MAEYDSEKENDLAEGCENGDCKTPSFCSGQAGPGLGFAEESDVENHFVAQPNMNAFFGVSNSGFEELSDELKKLPLSILTDRQRKSLGNLLDRRRPLGGDFEDLAGNLFPDLNNDKLFKIEKQKHPTVYLLRKFENEKKDQATIFRLVEIAYSMRRLDVVQLLMNAAKGHLEKPKKGLLNILKRKLFQEDDTISITSVISTTSSLATLSSYPSSASLWSTESYSGNFEVPLKQSNFSVEKVENETILQEQNSKNNNKEKRSGEGQPSIFVVSASDEKENVVKLVKWLRKKGMNANSIETSKLDYEESPSRFVKLQLDNCDNVLVVCSQRLKTIVDQKRGQIPSKGDAEVVQYVFEYLNNEIFCNLSNKSKYIPLVPDKQSKTSGRDSIIPMPLSLPEAYYFENKGNRQDLLRRLYKKEKYKLPPIGNRPIIRQNVITGELLDLQK